MRQYELILASGSQTRKDLMDRFKAGLSLYLS